MDLELTDEQKWLSESIDTLLTREWPAPEAVCASTLEQRRRVWTELVSFGALSIGEDDGIGAIEACLIAERIGWHLAAVPYIGSAALRLALADEDAQLPPAAGANADAAVALSLLEPGSSWTLSDPATHLRAHNHGYTLSGEKVAVEQTDLADWVVVLASLDAEPAFGFVPIEGPGIVIESRASFDPSLPMSAATFADAPVNPDAALTGPAATQALGRLRSTGALLAAAEAIGATERIVDLARGYAAERRQFGRTIGSFQSLRHILADMYVRCASGWSTVLYAAAALDDGASDAAQTASIAKAYVSRSAREAAHGALQVFGGIAFTEEHPAHRFLRRIIVRERQFGDAGHHERALGRALASDVGRSLGRVPEVSPA